MEQTTINISCRRSYCETKETITLLPGTCTKYYGITPFFQLHSGLQAGKKSTHYTVEYMCIVQGVYPHMIAYYIIFQERHCEQMFANYMIACCG